MVIFGPEELYHAKDIKKFSVEKKKIHKNCFFLGKFCFKDFLRFAFSLGKNHSAPYFPTTFVIIFKNDIKEIVIENSR